MPFNYVDELDTEFHLTALVTIARDHQAINAAEYDALLSFVDVMVRRDRRAAWLGYWSDTIAAFVHWKVQAALYALLFPLAVFVPGLFVALSACGLLVTVFSLVNLLATIRSHQLKRRVMNDTMGMVKVLTDKLPKNPQSAAAMGELMRQIVARREARS